MVSDARVRMVSLLGGRAEGGSETCWASELGERHSSQPSQARDAASSELLSFAMHETGLERSAWMAANRAHRVANNPQFGARAVNTSSPATGVVLVGCAGLHCWWMALRTSKLIAGCD